VTILNVSTAPGDFHTIQDAVNAAVNGDTIEIAPGTYVEQVTINGKDLTVHGAGDGMNGTIIASPVAASLVVNATDPNAARPNKFAVVAVTGGANVTIDGLAVDGRRQGFQNRADYDFVGVYVLNSDAVINGVAVSNIVSDQLFGAQRNIAIIATSHDVAHGSISDAPKLKRVPFLCPFGHVFWIAPPPLACASEQSDYVPLACQTC
jgi:hypothetical protein